MFNKYFRKYIYKYALALIFGIFVLISIDFIQIRIPRHIGSVINMLDNSQILKEIDLINKEDIDELDYYLSFELRKEEDGDRTAIYWYRVDKLDNSESKARLLITNEDYEKISDFDVENSIINIENNNLMINDEVIVSTKELNIYLNNSYEKNLKDIVILILIIVLIVAVGRFLWRLAIFGTSRNIEYSLRNEMFIHATTLSQDYYSHQKVGGMMTYFINDLNAIRMAFGPGIMMLIDSVFLGTFTLIRMFQLNTQITFIILIPIIGLIFGMMLINKSMRKQFRIRQEKFRDLSDYTQENISGLSVIKAYVREAYEIMTFKKLSKDLYDTNIKFFKRAIFIEIITAIAINIVVIAIIGFGSLAVVRTINLPENQQFQVGELTEYIALFLTLSWPTRALARFLSMNSQAQASAQRITEFLETKPSVYDKEDVLNIESINPSIKVENLDFMYPDGNDLVLKNINFEIKAGEMVGILGKTGSGKTTLVDILLRVYNVDNEKVFLGGYDIMNLPLKTVRNTVGYVPQDNFLFSDTIKKNIGFSKDTLTDEKIIDSAKLADIYDNVIEFKEGFDTVLGERGVTVSGGQKQRISIARALAKDPDILILDDSVSAVDTKTEETIINNLYNLRKGKTTIFIAHRISTVKDLDKIIIVDDGKIVGIGTHKELLEKSSFYQDIVRRQTLEEKVEGGSF